MNKVLTDKHTPGKLQRLINPATKQRAYHLYTVDPSQLFGDCGRFVIKDLDERHIGRVNANDLGSENQHHEKG